MTEIVKGTGERLGICDFAWNPWIGSKDFIQKSGDRC